ncbi:hypothetical protein Ahy_A07g036444 isoform A [Arachis hypogaea]|uniref:Uncharacterized protein n=1 Tax=Arachis hypogaea TaxID=3818 RepID=A0A445CG61_ARAHY|nr:hypothetical protein Ahy_A07g036444 isoform A [Arachis hypogaea]
MFCLLCELWISQPCISQNFLSMRIWVCFGEGNVTVEDGEFSVGMKLGSRELVVSAIKGYTISRGVDYTVYESKPQTFYVKCKGYGVGCDWLILASLIQKKGDTITDAIRPLVEAEPSIKVISIFTEVQSRFNYTVSYRKAWLAKQKSATKVFAYSRTEQEYNKNYDRLKKRGEAYTRWCEEIGVQRWVLAFDGGHR